MRRKPFGPKLGTMLTVNRRKIWPRPPRLDDARRGLHSLYEGKSEPNAASSTSGRRLTPWQSFYSSIVVYNIAVCLTKISILLQYRRIFTNTMLRHIISYGLCFLVCWGITLSILLPLVCLPTAAFWDDSVDGFCLDNATIWYVMAGVNVVTDFAIFTMPIPVISSLHLPTRQKAMLLVVFTLGVL